MSCRTGKITYTTAAKAWAVVGRVRKTLHTGQSRAYRCKVCNLWHLTSSMRDSGHETMWQAKQGNAA